MYTRTYGCTLGLKNPEEYSFVTEKDWDAKKGQKVCMMRMYICTYMSAFLGLL